MRRLSLLLIVFAAAAGVADAQTPAIQVRAAFGASNYLHSDIEYVAPTVLFAVRAGTRRFAIEPEVALAWHSESETFPGAGFTGPVVVERSRQFRSVGVNAIARGRGRISPFFGGGVGVYAERRRTKTDGHEQTLTFGPRAGTQIVGGIDGRVAPRLMVFGQGRYEVRSFSDVGGGSVFQAFAGVAVALR
ncbi:MAG TPA: hypothetical protein VFK57_05160 [Vicinamibacterales bacterium]|nr:hypothetical protein [Vicinamibacterales bacterium]